MKTDIMGIRPTKLKTSKLTDMARKTNYITVFINSEMKLATISVNVDISRNRDTFLITIQ
jgi:hypothetical protein